MQLRFSNTLLQELRVSLCQSPMVRIILLSNVRCVAAYTEQISRWGFHIFLWYRWYNRCCIRLLHIRAEFCKYLIKWKHQRNEVSQVSNLIVSLILFKSPTGEPKRPVGNIQPALIHTSKVLLGLYIVPYTLLASFEYFIFLIMRWNNNPRHFCCTCQTVSRFSHQMPLLYNS